MAIMAITPVQYKDSSPYFTSGYLDGKFLDLMNNRTFPFEADDIFQQIGPTYQYRPDLLSFDLYKTSAYWWVFAVRNKDIIKDPVYDMVSGLVIKLPQLATLKSVLGI
jgi:hypothetical protein